MVISDRAAAANTREFFFFSSRRRHTRFDCDWSSDVCSSDLPERIGEDARHRVEPRLRDPDAGGVARGAELNARRKRAVVVAEVAGDEEGEPVAGDRAAQGEAGLLLLIVGDGYGHAVRIAAHEILVLHGPERRPME